VERVINLRSGIVAMSAGLIIAACGATAPTSSSTPPESNAVAPTPTATASSTGAPQPADVQAKLVSVADVSGSSLGNMQQDFGSNVAGAVQPCIRPGPGSGTSAGAQAVGAEVSQPVKRAAAESAIEVVLVSSSADVAADRQQTASALQQLESGARACPPTDSQTIQGRGITVADTVSTSAATIGRWTGTLTTSASTVNPPQSNGVAKYVDYVYYLTSTQNAFLVLELDVAFGNVSPSAQYQATAAQLATTLAARLPS
jgi:hypothetical protein